MSTEPIPSTPSTLPDHRRRTGAIAVGIVAGVLVLYGLLVAVSGGGVPRGTTVLGVDIGGQSVTDATATLEDELGELAVQPLEASLAGKPLTVPPEQLGFAFDAQATAEQAQARTFNPLTLLSRLLARQELDPVVTVDDATLAGYLEDVGSAVDEPPTEGDVTFTQTTAEAVEPVAGSGLDRTAAAAVLRAAYLRNDVPVVLPIVKVEPVVDAEAVDEAMRTFGVPAMAGPVTLTVENDRAGGNRSIRLKPREFGPSLSMRPTPDGSLEPVVAVKSLRAVVDERLGGPLREPRDATFKIRNGRPVVVRSVQGQTVNGDDLSVALLAVLPLAEGRTATVGVETIEPALTTAEARALGVDERLSTFTQAFPYAAYRVQNIGQAARYLDGTLLMPGETFSMNKTVKERTEENGYTVGFVISGGRFAEELGGGVSTATTATWHTAFFAGMERVEQRAHSFYISRYLPGLEATVSWGNLDLRFRNDSPHAVLIKASITNSSVTVSMYGTKRYDISAEFGPRTDVRGFSRVYNSSPGCVPQPGVNGFRIVVTRVFRDLDGAVVKREPLTTRYAAATNVICGSKPKPKPSPSTSPKPKPTPKPSGSG
ncbi:MAG TPA: VanW family protein [Candidatus Limnocylindria bacterium]|nr:VanW family protein [Candidatus Limnocylindria bacterium]